jgi:hypothetical protein
MAKDRFSALWVSHSSIGDWLACPRAYYLKNVYRDPKSRHKLTLMSPPLALGQIVHEVIEGLSTLAVGRRFSEPLTLKFDRAWPKVSKWFDQDEAVKYKERGRAMLKNLMDHPGPLTNLAVKIKMELPYFWLSEPDEIILCGRIDWLEYLPESDSVHIIDFKTGKNEESQDSLQLKIYYLLAGHTQERPVAKLSYWYLDRDSAPKSQALPDPKKAEAKILKIAKEIKLARKLERFKCPHGGCRHCQPYEDILSGKAEFIGVDSKGYDLYKQAENTKVKSEIL